MKLHAPAQQATIAHPKHPEIRVTVEKPPIKDIIAWEDIMEQYTPKPELAVHPVTGKVLRDAAGKAVERPTSAKIPFDVTLDTMVKYVKGVEGFEDVRYSELPMDGRKDVLRELLDSRFNWKAEEEVPVRDDDGKPEKDKNGKPVMEKKEVTHNFYHFTVRKIFDQETYGDPLGSGSENTATGDSA